MVNSAKKDLKRRTEFYTNMCRLQFFKYIVHNHNIPSLVRVRYKALSVAHKTTKAGKWPVNGPLGALLALTPTGYAPSSFRGNPYGARGLQKHKGHLSSTAFGLRTTLEPTTGIKIKIRNRCIITGRGRGVYRFCKLSRGPLQEKALGGHLNGISKSSW